MSRDHFLAFFFIFSLKIPFDSPLFVREDETEMMKHHSDFYDARDRDTSGQLRKGVDLLSALVASVNPLSLGELASACGQPKATTHRLLATLCALQLVSARNDGRYSLGPRCLTLGSAYLGGLDLRREALPILQQLVATTNETAHLGVSGGDKVVLIEQAEPDRSIRMVSRVGANSPLHATSIGKVLLAYGTADDLEALLDQGVERLTSNTITDPQELRFALKRVREMGFAINDIEYEEGIRCVGAPVYDHTGKVIAGISVSCPDFRTPRDRLLELAPQVIAAAQQLSVRMGFDPATIRNSDPTS